MDKLQQKIKGYRELSAEDISIINDIKAKSAEVGELVADLRSEPGFDQRWIAGGATYLQKGFMSLTRGVSKPDFF